MDLNRFLHERRPRWQRLSELLDKVDRVGLAALPPQQVDELFSLYRLVSSDLNLVQTRTANPAMLEYLEAVVGRAYANLAVPRRTNPLIAWWTILRHRFPAILRRERTLLALATAAFLAGVCFGFFATLLVPDTAMVFVPAEHLFQTPAERVAELEAMERGDASPISSAGEYSFFSAFLFTHNIRVTVLAFALGLTFGVGTVIVLFFNGAMLGSIAAMYLNDGVFTFFVAWVGPHGAIELPCILFGSTAGLMLARAQLRVDAGSTWSQVRQMRPDLLRLIIGTATLLVLAGFIEGGFSQINEPTLPYPLKIAVAALLFGGLLAYVFWMPVRAAADDESLRATAGS